MPDEPNLESEFDASNIPPEVDPAVRRSIQALIQENPFAVLCTQAGGQPYGSLIAFACSEDLRCFVFATSEATRKYRLLTECDRVALLADNRGRFPDDMMKVSAVTITGRASRIESGADLEQWSRLLVERHPYLKQFVRAPTTALFRVDAVRFLHVTRFQEVRQWVPTPNG